MNWLFAACAAMSSSALVGARQRRDHDHRMLREPSAHDGRRTLDRRRVADGRAAELGDDHATPDRPVATSSSALRIEPPAAPRNGVVPHRDELQVEQRVHAHAPHRHRHAAPAP